MSKEPKVPPEIDAALLEYYSAAVDYYTGDYWDRDMSLEDAEAALDKATAELKQAIVDFKEGRTCV